MKNYEKFLRNDEDLKNWVTNLMNINDHFLSHLTPNLKEEASYKLFNVSFKELNNLILATKNYNFVLNHARSEEIKKVALTAIRSMIKSQIKKRGFQFKELGSQEKSIQA